MSAGSAELSDFFSGIFGINPRPSLNIHPSDSKYPNQVSKYKQQLTFIKPIIQISGMMREGGRGRVIVCIVSLFIIFSSVDIINHAVLIHISAGKLRGTQHKGRNSAGYNPINLDRTVQKVCTVRVQVYSMLNKFGFD